MSRFEFTFTPVTQPQRTIMINAKVSKQEAATIDALAVLLGLRGGRSGVVRKGLDTLIASLPEDTRTNLLDMIKATIAPEEEPS